MHKEQCIFIVKMIRKGLITPLLLLASCYVYGQSVYTKIYTYTLNKKYDTIYTSKQVFDVSGRQLQETKGHREKKIETKYYNTDSTSIGISIYENGDTLFSLSHYTNNILTAKRSTKYNANQHQWEDTLVSTYTYNNAGQPIEELIWHKKNEQGNIILNTWNTNRIIYNYDNVGKLLSKKTYYIYSLNDWDKELLKNKADRLEDTIKLTSSTYTYKPKGYTRIDYDINNIELYDTAYITYEFDKFNRVYKEIERKKSILSETTIRTYSYHPEKRIDREIYYNAADKLQRVNIYVYEH